MRVTEVDASTIVTAVMDEWAAGVDAHDPDRVASAFTTDAVFQGLRPHGVGRAAVRAYYDSQPAGMTVTYRVLESRSPATDVVSGYLLATFAFADGTAVQANLGVVLTRQDDDWSILQYQASRVG
ncbi:YybH family protein [Mycolicibacterium sediminis]|uniref:SnoaL-like domain-containing protein n=1 Tax=Mycolicibacterium sediminis TaxID=1286180 RepID=A0A7I7QHV3_9MYCO|nr:SgcJ/EcaC family oxidoreductase [Mycolicibacterium sediminis]BBY25919.1 hypothetical protein MSEDJ_00150 [Mycolicibacterium sediminis]